MQKYFYFALILLLKKQTLQSFNIIIPRLQLTKLIIISRSLISLKTYSWCMYSNLTRRVFGTSNSSPTSGKLPAEFIFVYT